MIHMRRPHGIHGGAAAQVEAAGDAVIDVGNFNNGWVIGEISGDCLPANKGGSLVVHGWTMAEDLVKLGARQLV